MKVIQDTKPQVVVIEKIRTFLRIYIIAYKVTGMVDKMSIATTENIVWNFQVQILSFVPNWGADFKQKLYNHPL